MKGERELRLWKRSLGLDAGRNIAASYTDGGSFWARLWPAAYERRGDGGRPRFLLVGDNNPPIEEGDRIEEGLLRYRALRVRSFPKHVEALVEEEEG